MKKIAKSILAASDLIKARKLVVMAQAILESGHGSSDLATDHNNYFGLKWRESRMTGFATPVPYCDHAGECEDYCKFENEKACIVGYIQFIKTGPYDLDGIATPEDYIDALVEGGYAADSQYKAKLMTLLPTALQALTDAGADEDDFDFESQGPANAAIGQKLKLAIVVGHTSSAPGACASSPIDECEFTYNSDIAQEMMSLADSYDIVGKVIFRQSGLSYKRQIERAYAEADAFGADISIELHFNAASPAAKGTETLSSGTARSLEYARATQDEVHGIVNRADRSVKVRRANERGGLSLHSGRAPAILVEPFFGSNKKDRQRAYSIGKKGFAEAYLKGAHKYGTDRGII